MLWREDELCLRINARAGTLPTPAEGVIGILDVQKVVRRTSRLVKIAEGAGLQLRSPLAPPDPASRRCREPGGLAQCDLWLLAGPRACLTHAGKRQSALSDRGGSPGNAARRVWPCPLRWPTPTQRLGITRAAGDTATGTCEGSGQHSRSYLGFGDPLQSGRPPGDIGAQRGAPPSRRQTRPRA